MLRQGSIFDMRNGARDGVADQSLLTGRMLMTEVGKVADLRADGASAEGADPPERSLPTSLGFKLRRLQLAYKRKYQLSTRAIDISTDQIGALSLVSRNPGLTPTDLAALLTLDGAQVTPILKQLEARDLVCRTKSASDSRSYQVWTTAKGEAEYRRIQVIIAKFEDAFIREVLQPEELQHLYQLLDRLEVAAKSDM
jgi:MarR family transcriptional regulator, temperature-dependent positive regulator of motility